MKIALLLFPIFLFAEFYERELSSSPTSPSLPYKSEFYYDSVLSCDEVREKKRKIEIELEIARRNRTPVTYSEFDLLLLPFILISGIEHDYSNSRLENLKSLEIEKCYGVQE